MELSSSDTGASEQIEIRLGFVRKIEEHSAEAFTVPQGVGRAPHCEGDGYPCEAALEEFAGRFRDREEEEA